MATLTKRGNFWRAQVCRRGFQPQHKTFDTRAEAEAWGRSTESEMDRGIFVSRAVPRSMVNRRVVNRRVANRCK